LQPATEKEGYQIIEFSGDVFISNLKIFIWLKVLKSTNKLRVWYFNVLIELFQVEICLSQQHEKSTYYFGGHKIEEQILWNFYFHTRVAIY